MLTWMFEVLYLWGVLEFLFHIVVEGHSPLKVLRAINKTGSFILYKIED